MKSLLLFLISTVTATAQVTVTLASVAAGEPALSVTVSSTGVSNLTAWIATAPPNLGWPNSAGVPVNTTLASGVNAAVTSIPLTSGTNLQTCNGLLIDSEVMAVVSVSTNTATVIRASASTSAATHSSSAPVTVLRSGNYTCQMKVFWADGIVHVTNSKLQGAAITAQTAAKATAEASIAATLASAVQ